MSKPGFNLEGPFPRLTVELPLCHPRECHECGALENLRHWQEHDTADVPEFRYVVLCDRCAGVLIEPHPRLYRCLAENEPAPGVMPICLNCAHRAGSQCWHPRSWMLGHRELRLEHPVPDVVIVRHARNSEGRTNTRHIIYKGPVYNCSGKEIVGSVLPA